MNQVKIILKSHQNVVIVSSDQIVALTATGTYTNIILVSGKSVIMSKPLKYFEKKLNGAGFFRCHKSHIVNPKFFTEFNMIKGTALFSGIEIPVSRRNKSEFIKKVYEIFTVENANMTANK
jgi:two-component system LytT family response regulator